MEYFVYVDTVGPKCGINTVLVGVVEFVDREVDKLERERPM